MKIFIDADYKCHTENPDAQCGIQVGRSGGRLQFMDCNPIIYDDDHDVSGLLEED